MRMDSLEEGREEEFGDAFAVVDDEDSDHFSARVGEGRRGAWGADGEAGRRRGGRDQLESAVELSSSLQAQHAAAQSTISALES
jgi:hypothetical protein